MNAAVGGKIQFGALAGAGDADMGEAAFFLEPGAALFVERALMRKQPFLPAGQEHGVEFQALGGMQRHHRHRVFVAAAVAVHHQRDMFEETLQVLEILHRADQFFQVFQPARGVGRTVLLPHLGIAALIEHDLRQLGVRQQLALRAPALERHHQIAQAAAGFRLQLIGLDDRACRFIKRNAPAPAVVVQQLHGGIANAALGHIDDALKGEVVGRRVDHPQISERVADFRALIEARAADHAIGQAERDKAIFKFAHLERGAHQNRDLVERVALALQLFDLFADRARFFLGIPGAGDGDLFAIDVFGAQRLAEPAFVMRDQIGRRGQDVAGRAIIALQPDHLGAGKIVLEAQDVIDLGAAPAIDRLIVITDAADVLWRGGVLTLSTCGRGWRRAERDAG